MRYDILSLFPDYFSGPLRVSLMKRAIERGLIEVNLVDIRSFAKGPYRRVDDRPYGGGPGMVMIVEPIVSAIRSVRRESSRVIYLSPQGAPLTARRCRDFAQLEHLVLLCGHYEGVDERVLDLEVDEEISIGDYVLTSGAPAAAVFIDAVSRFIPGVVGNWEGIQQDSFESDRFDAPLYTRPSIFEGIEVPGVLLGGDHMAIASWRRERGEEKKRRVRPDLEGNGKERKR